jgi:hypothetical protein
MKSEIVEELKKNRPLLSETSLKTYASLLERLLKKFGIESLADLEKHEQTILEHLKTIESPQTRKTTLSPLVILTDAKSYKELMSETTKIINDKYRGQKVDLDKLKDMKTMEELKEFNRQLEIKAGKNKTEQDYQNLLISYFFTGVIDGLPPRRLQDYTEMKISNYDKNSDNWTDGKQLVFNKFKTAKHSGQQKITIPKEIQAMVKRAIKLNDTEYLLHNNGNQYTTPSMSKKLKATYGVSVDGLRSIFISHMYKGLPALEKMEQVAEDMGHSVGTALNHYVKTDLQR